MYLTRRLEQVQAPQAQGRAEVGLGRKAEPKSKQWLDQKLKAKD